MLGGGERDSARSPPQLFDSHLGLNRSILRTWSIVARRGGLGGGRTPTDTPPVVRWTTSPVGILVPTFKLYVCIYCLMPSKCEPTSNVAPLHKVPLFSLFGTCQGIHKLHSVAKLGDVI